MLASTTRWRQLSIESLGAANTLEQVRKLEQRWSWLLGSNSSLPIFSEADLIRPLSEFLSIDSLLSRALARLLLEDKQSADSYPQPGASFKVSTEETSGIGRVNIAADEERPTIAGQGSSGGCTVERIHASSKESKPVLAREKCSITRDEARDHFNKIAHRAGLRWAWDNHFVADSESSKTPERILSRAPTPGLRRFWMEASTADKVMDQLRTLEQKCASLFRSNAEKRIFLQEDLVRPLVEFLGIDEKLAGPLVPLVVEDRQNLERLSRSDPASRQLPAGDDLTPKPRVVSTANSAGPLPSLPVEKDPSAEPRSRVAGRRSTSIATNLEGALPKEAAPKALLKNQGVLFATRTRPPVRINIPITRAQARAHFDEIAEQAGLHSVWNELAITTSQTGLTFDIPDHTSEAATFAIPRVLNLERAVEDAGVTYHDSPSSVFASAVSRSANSANSGGVGSTAAQPNALGVVHVDSVTTDQKVKEDRWDRVLRPIVKTIQSSQRLARTKPASAETRVGTQRRSETSDPMPSSEVPLTGLRRLAEMAVDADDAATNDETQTIFGGRPMTSAAPRLPIATHVVTGDEADFASQLAAFLRSEVLRHGISLEKI